MNLDAIEQTQLWRQHRVDGVGRLKFDFHAGITWAVIFAVIVLVVFLVAICLFLKCRKAQQEARARGSTNWQAPPPSVELGKPEPAPGHWRPADEMQTQTPV